MADEPREDLPVAPAPAPSPTVDIKVGEQTTAPEPEEVEKEFTPPDRPHLQFDFDGDDPDPVPEPVVEEEPEPVRSRAAPREEEEAFDWTALSRRPIPPPHPIPEEVDLNLEELADKPVEAIKRYVEAQRAQIRAELERDRQQQVNKQVAKRVESNFTRGKDHFDGSVMTDPAYKDPKVQKAVMDLTKIAMQNGMADPQTSEAFRDPVFWKGLMAMAKERVGYRGTPKPQPTVVQPAGAKVLSAKQATGESTPRKSISADRMAYLSQWGLSPEDVARNEREAREDKARK
jgi:hypothetical protein